MGTAARFFVSLARSMVKVYRVYDYRQESYLYDTNGNRSSETITTLYPRTYDYSYYTNTDRLKTRISTEGGMKWAFVYDNNGNLIKKGNTFETSGETVDFTAEGEGVIYWEYDYDVFNRLTAVRKNGAETSRYVYDPVGLRIYKDGTKDVLYDYDLGGNVICEIDLGTGEVRSYVWVSGRHLARVDGVIGGAGEKYFYECDHLGSPQVVTGKDGEPVWRGDFTPFGEKIEGEWSFVDTHGFTGKDWDEDTGLYYFNARWYDPELGRFITENQVNDPNNPNLYTYCAGNPISKIDPSGNDLEDFNLWDPSTWFNTHKRMTYESETGYGDVRYGLYVEQDIRDGKVYSTTKIETFVNSDGDTITLTTQVIAGKITQSYSIISDGKTIKSETVTYKNGVSNQRNIIAVDDFINYGKSESYNPFKALMIVTNQEGAIGVYSGSTRPQDTSKYAIIRETEIENPYEIHAVTHRGSSFTYQAFNLRLNGSNQIPIEQDKNPYEGGGNPGKPYATGINIHAGVNYGISSYGCQNIAPLGKRWANIEKEYKEVPDPNDPTKTKRVKVSRVLGNEIMKQYWPKWVEFYDVMNPQPRTDQEFVGYYYLTRLD